jgi:hypothetical protein
MHPIGWSVTFQGQTEVPTQAKGYGKRFLVAKCETWKKRSLMVAEKQSHDHLFICIGSRSFSLKISAVAVGTAPPVTTSVPMISSMRNRL